MIYAIVFLLVPGRPQDDGREEFVGYDGAPQQLARADYMFIADLLVQAAGTLTIGKGRYIF